MKFFLGMMAVLTAATATSLAQEATWEQYGQAHPPGLAPSYGMRPASFVSPGNHSEAMLAAGAVTSGVSDQVVYESSSATHPGFANGHCFGNCSLWGDYCQCDYQGDCPCHCQHFGLGAGACHGWFRYGVPTCDCPSPCGCQSDCGATSCCDQDAAEIDSVDDSDFVHPEEPVEADGVPEPELQPDPDDDPPLTFPGLGADT